MAEWRRQRDGHGANAPHPELAGRPLEMVSEMPTVALTLPGKVPRLPFLAFGIRSMPLIRDQDARPDTSIKNTKLVPIH